MQTAKTKPTPSQKHARKAATERQARYRAAQRSMARPMSRDVDKAIVEATSFLISVQRAAPVLIDLVTLSKLAVRILVRDGYDRAASKVEVARRLKPRPEHSSTTAIPTRIPPIDDDLFDPPRRGGSQWSTGDLDFMRAIATGA